MAESIAIQTHDYKQQFCVTIYVSVFFVVISSLLISMEVYANKKNLFITHVEPSPNYSLTTDKYDREQIVDGRITNGKMWLHSSAVGWLRKTPVVIKIDVRSNEKINIDRHTLSVRTGAGSKQDVYMPRRIDVYGKYSDKDDKYSYLGVINSESNIYSKHRSTWLSLDYVGEYDLLVLVLHADKAFLFIDEVKLENNDKPEQHDSYTVHEENIIDPKTDSIKRLKERLSAEWENNHDEEFNYSNVNGSCKVYFESCWQGFSPGKGALPMLDKMKIFGYEGESESVCITVRNEDQNKPLKLSIKSNQLAEDDNLKLFDIQQVLASDGSVVNDPLIPIDNSDKIAISSNTSKHFMFSVPIRKDANKNIAITVKSEDGSCNKSLQVALNKIKIDVSGIEANAVNWGYHSDEPIWNDPLKTVEDLSAHGINTIVIHPSLLMNKNKDIHKSPDKFLSLINYIKSYPPETKFILFLGLSNERRVKLLHIDKIFSEADTKKLKIPALREWFVGLIAAMKQAKASNRWWLYPFDETGDDTLQKIIKLGQWIEKEKLGVRIYSNPLRGGNRSNSTSIGYLERANAYVDWWQPTLSFAEGEGGKFFTKLEKPWSIYHNPPQPVKSASPLGDYRLPAWRAWLLGADGLGFWSYSDTGGSSAWDDFDGYRADWAVVYESEKGPVSSIRWEAFREGLEDLKLLYAVDQFANINNKPYLSEIVRDEVKRAMRGNGNVDPAYQVREIIYNLVPK